jgi:hypothetical protein
MLHCIIGVLLACGGNANQTIPGKVAYAPVANTSYAWTYAAILTPPTRGGNLYIPAYANEVPIFIPTTPGVPAAITRATYRG